MEHAFCCCPGVCGRCCVAARWPRLHRNFRTSRYATLRAPRRAAQVTSSPAPLALAMSEGLGVQVVIDNRPGAGNTIGAEIAARAVPDGYTIFGCNIASLAVSPALYRKLDYDPERDFVPIGLVASNPNVLTVHPSLPAATIAQFIALAKAHPGKLNYGSAGIGTSPQLSMELLRMQSEHQHRAHPVQRRRAGVGRLDRRAVSKRCFRPCHRRSRRYAEARSVRSV